MRKNLIKLAAIVFISVLFPSFVKAQQSVQIQVPCASNLILPASNYPNITDFFVNLNCNVASTSVTGIVTPGQEVVITLTQDVIGGRSFVWPANFVSTAIPTLPVSPNGTSASTWQWCGFTTVFGNACPAGFWQNADQGPVNAAPLIPNIIDPVSQFGAAFDAIIAYHVTTSSGSGLVTCPNGCNFTQALVGKQGFVTTCNNGAGCGASAVIGTVGSAAPTVSSVTDANHLTLSATAGSNCTAACTLVVGTDTAANDTALNNAYNAAATTCGTLQMPPGNIIIETAKFNETPTTPATNNCINGAQTSRQVPVVHGYGSSATRLIPSIGFNTSSCTITVQVRPSCFGASLNLGGIALEHFGIFGAGLSPSGSTGLNIVYAGFPGNNWTIDDVELTAWNSADANAIGLFIGGGNTLFNNVQVDGFGGNPCEIYNTNNQYTNLQFCGDSPGPGLTIQNGTAITYGGMYCSTGSPVVSVQSGGSWTSFGEQVGSASCGTVPSQQGINASNTITLDGTVVMANGSSGVAVQANGNVTLNMHNATLQATGTGGHLFHLFSTNTLNDEGGNTLTATGGYGDGTSLSAFNVSAANLVAGACTGTATSSSTLGLYGTGPNITATTCTAAVGAGIVQTKSRTLNNLNVTASHAGVNASSGVVTVLKNGGATALTCTIGTGTSCFDVTHSVATVAGDLISIQFTTQAAEVLAGVQASVWPMSF